MRAHCADPHSPWPCARARGGGLTSMSRCATDVSVAVIRNTQRSVGLMDKASAPGAGDSRFESWADQLAVQLPAPGQHLGTRCSTHNARPRVERAAHEGTVHRFHLPWPCSRARGGGLPSMSRCATDASVAVIRTTQRSVGLMDKASASGAEDCGFESHRGRFCFRGGVSRIEVIGGYLFR